jgi:AcrR family transcriptional regulator
MVATHPETPSSGYARRRAATRRRIVEATVELHTTVGPARTSISAIAERAGVQRHTVYAHFPEEQELFRACSAHWRARNPFPDAARWHAIRDPEARLALALTEVYRFYEEHAPALEAIFADADKVPMMAEAVASRAAQLAGAARVLSRGRGLRGRQRTRALAALTHALDLGTWRSLVERGGLQRDEAVTLMADLVRSACERQTRSGVA